MYAADIEADQYAATIELTDSTYWMLYEDGEVMLYEDGEIMIYEEG